MLELFMNLGTMLSTAASVPKIIAVLRNRNLLRGFSISGILLKLAAILCFTAAQAMLGIWLSVGFNGLLILYNLVKLFYVWRIERPQDGERARRFIDNIVKRKRRRLMGGTM